MLAALRREGICLDGQSGLAINVARDLKICRFPQDSAPVFLRILAQSKGERDLAHLQALKCLLGDYVNGPTKIVRTEDAVCGVFPFVEHERVSYESVLSQGLLGQVCDVLAKLHAGGSALGIEGPRLSPLEVASELREQSGPGESFRAYLEQNFLPFVERLPSVPQHGDFTYVNLVSTEGGRLIVFDWEDYGLVRYPGFDLATFLVSHYRHADWLERLVISPASLTDALERDFGQDMLPELGLTREQFALAFPGYLAVFLTLKKNGFGVRVIKRMRDLLMRILDSANWQATLGIRGA